MSTDMFSSRGGVDTRSHDEQARAAVKEFRKIQPTLTAFARAYTGNPKVRVEMSATSNGMTDSKRIFLRPPLALGKRTPHDRDLCDKRDELLQQRCEACWVREAVLIAIYHEIGHIAHGTFAKVDDRDKANLLRTALRTVDKKFARAVEAKINNAHPTMTQSYMGMAQLVSPFMPAILNCLEDARINREAYLVRKGLRVMFEADTLHVMNKGVEQKDSQTGETVVVKWNEYPLNAQMAVALYCVVNNFDISNWFVPEVIAATKDRTVQGLLRQFPTIRSVSGVYQLSIPLFMRLRELGFFKSPSDPASEPEEEQQADEDQEGPGQPDPSGDDGRGEAQDGAEDASPGAESDEEPGEEDQSDPIFGDSSGDSSGQGEAPPSEDAGTGEEGDRGQGSPDPSGEEDSDAGGVQGEDPSVDSDPGESGDDESGDLSEHDSSSRSESGSGDSSQGSRGDTEADYASDNEGDGSPGDDSSDESDTQDSGTSPEGAVASENRGTSSNTEEGVDNAPSSAEGSEGDDAREGNEPSASDDTSSSDGSDRELSDGESDSGDPQGELGDRGSGDSSGRDDLSNESAEASTGNSPDSGSVEVSEDSVDNASGTEESPEEDASEDESTVHSDSDDEPEPLDSGADEGLGGVEVIENSAFDTVPMGTPEDLNEILHQVMHPEERPETVAEQGTPRQRKEMDRAIIQGLYFETPSRNVFGVREHRWGQPLIEDGYNLSAAWDTEYRDYWGGQGSLKELGIAGDFHCEETILGPALLRMRVAFADNQRGHETRHRKSGKIDARVLGKRANLGDERLFKHRTIPGKKDYFVLIGIDISGSTIGKNLALAKRAAMAQAELCSRMGIAFGVYAHSAKEHEPGTGRIGGIDLDVYFIKEPDEPWTSETKQRLEELGFDSLNVDGHTLEYYRKILDKRSETHRVILYYTDGKMPAENHDEELEILQREIKICRQKKYTLLGVGIRTDSPTRHGLDTVQVDGDEDIVKVVKHLEKALLKI